jgi:Fe-S-cluster containining protein
MAKNGSGAPPKKSFELPMLELPGTHPCSECGACCAYVAVEIDNPSSFDDYDHIHWYLTHRGVSVYIDWEGDWFIEFETICEHRTEAMTCGIYEDRPRICSDFSWNECEKTTKEAAHKVRFEKPQEIFDWLREKRPRNFERYMKSREKLLEKRASARTGGSAEQTAS